MKSALKYLSIPLMMLFCLTAYLSTSIVLPQPAQAASKKDRAVVFMKAVAKELMAAVRSGDKRNLELVINKYADLKAIGNYSLGDYEKKLPRRKRPKYYRGVAKFMARYFMDESKKYKVRSAKVSSPSFKEYGESIVDSVVRLEDGSQYEVQWRLTKKNRRFKIRDIRILGLWMVPYQRNLFNDFVVKRGGNVNDLVIALNHN